MKYETRFPRNVITPVTLLIVLNLGLFSQDKSLELAKTYEADGMYEKALSIYERLYRADSNSSAILEPLKNVYKILGRNDLRLRIIVRQAAADSLNIVLLCELTDAYIRTKRISEARGVVSRALRIHPKSAMHYRLVAATLNENQMFDDAIGVYLQGRKNLADEKLFVIETANLYGYRGDVYAAVKEYLKYYHNEPNAADYVKSQILQFPDNEKNHASVIKGLTEDLAVNEDLKIQKVLIDVYFRSRNYDAAFEQCKAVDSRYHQKGIEVLNFAKTAFDNGFYSAAQKAYAYFLQLYTNAPQAELGLARCLEKIDGLPTQSFQDSSRTGEKIPENYFSNQAIRAYETVIRKYADSEWGAEAYYRIGTIRLGKFFDVDEALNNFLKSAAARSAYQTEALFAVSECHVIQGRLGLAASHYKSLAKESDNQALEERALFGLAETYFFDQKFDSSQALCDYLGQKEEGLFVNDALAFRLLYLETKSNPDPLKMYAKASLLARQNKLSEARTLFSELIKNNPSSPLTDDALLQTGIVLIMQKQYGEAIRVFKEIADDLKGSPLGDLALKKIGEIYEERLGDPYQAIQAYKDLLIRFPKSIYSNPVRKKVRELEKHLRKSL